MLRSVSESKPREESDLSGYREHLGVGLLLRNGQTGTLGELLGTGRLSVWITKEDGPN